ncbi:MAG: hypothetical protein WA814_00475 [Candidatus Baltobacteraceae bacterium]
MKKALGLCILALAIAAPAGAQSGGMTAMQYYVGKWSCTGTQTGQAPSKALLTYTLEDGILVQWVSVPMQGKMKTPYALSAATTYDSKNGRYVSTNLDSENAWSIGYGKMSGNTEQWTDHANSTGKLGRGELVRTDASSFTFTSWETVASTKPSFKAACHKAM